MLNEAKLILIGEGEVGKTSLIGALRGDDWVENRPTTHGVEVDIKTVVLDVHSDATNEQPLGASPRFSNDVNNTPEPDSDEPDPQEPDASALRLMCWVTNRISRRALAHGSRTT